MNQLINQLLLGGVITCCLMIGLFFCRFYVRTHDRLLLIFAIAFWLLGLNWLVLAFLHDDEIRTLLYVVRLGAFVLILVGILDKNRQTSGRRAK